MAAGGRHAFAPRGAIFFRTGVLTPRARTAVITPANPSRTIAHDAQSRLCETFFKRITDYGATRVAGFVCRVDRRSSV